MTQWLSTTVALSQPAWSVIGRRTRGRWQGLFLRADEQTGAWEVLTKTRGKLVPGEEIAIEDRDARHAMSLL